MKSKLFTSFFAFVFFSTFPLASASEGLDWRDRPASLKTSIDRAYNELARVSDGNWRMNGQKQYYIACTSQYAVAKHIINSDASRKDFYFLEIGAGGFQWGDEMATRGVQRISEYYYIFINGDLDMAAEQLVAISHAARLKMPSMKISEFIHEWEENS